MVCGYGPSASSSQHMYILVLFDFLATAHSKPLDGRRKESTLPFLFFNRHATKHRISLKKSVTSGTRPVTSVIRYILSIKLKAYSLGWVGQTLAY
jgi:hypothetical protein